MSTDLIIQTTDKLYREKNPDSKRDTPSFAYETVKVWHKQWLESKSDLSLYDWIKLNKSSK